jgi:hypothetical protein
MSRLTLLLHFLLRLVPFAKAAGTVQDLWIFPKAPDFTSELTVNTTIQIRWHEELQAVFAQFCTQCDTTNVDLWVTGSQYAEAVGGMYTPQHIALPLKSSIHVVGCEVLG